MLMKGWLLTLGLGAAAGAVTVLAMSPNNPARKMASQASNQLRRQLDM